MYIVFGGSRGIGAALAARLRSEGHSVLIAARGEAELEARASELGCEWQVCDARSFAEVEELVSRYPEARGLACCAGAILLKPAHLTSEDELSGLWEQNLKSSFSVVRAAGKRLRDASVVLFSSAAAAIGLPSHEAVAASKGAVEALVRSAAATYCSKGLRFNAIAPGLVRTSLSARIVERPAALEASAALHPLGRIGEPEEIAEMAYYLISSRSGWVTGQVFSVDGGLSRVRPR